MVHYSPKVLMIDVGGSSVRLMASGQEGFRKLESGRGMTAAKLVKQVLAETSDWKFDVISLGYPGDVRKNFAAKNPVRLGGGWVGYDFSIALGFPVVMMNSAAMHALANYDEGRLLFLGIGTSVGAALIADDAVIPLDVGMMRLSKSEPLMDRLSKKALSTRGKVRWQKAVDRTVNVLKDVFTPDRLIIGGGNAKFLEIAQEKCEKAGYQDAFRGAVRLWPGADLFAEPLTTTWRITRQPEKKSSKK